MARKSDDNREVIVPSELAQKKTNEWAEEMGMPAPYPAEPANADEARDAQDAAPSWADNEAAPEVMSNRDLRRAGLDGGNAGHFKGPQSTEIAVVGPNTAWVVNTLREDMRTLESDSANAVEDILGRILQAETADDILAEDGLIEAEELLGVPVQIWSYKVNESDFTDGMPGYLVIDAIRQDTGEKVTIGCGAVKVQAQILKLKRIGALPIVVKFVKNEKGTKAGRHPLSLVKA